MSAPRDDANNTTTSGGQGKAADVAASPASRGGGGGGGGGGGSGDYLRDRVAELEATLTREQARFQRATAEHDTLVTQLLTARRNNDILSGNVEALKALASQLGSQLETARTELEQAKDSAAATDMKLRRDAAHELVAVESSYEARLEDMRANAEEQKALIDELRERLREADADTEVAVARVATEKDLLIAELRREMNLLQGRLEYTEKKAAAGATSPGSSRRGSRTAAAAPSPEQFHYSNHTNTASTSSGVAHHRHHHPPQHSRGPSAASNTTVGGASTRSFPSRAGDGSRAYRAALTPWDTDAESEVSAAHHAVVDVKVAINKEDYARTRWKGLAAATQGPLSADKARAAAGGARYHIDVVTDAGFVDSIPYRPLQQQQRPPPPAMDEDETFAGGALEAFVDLSANPRHSASAATRGSSGGGGGGAGKAMLAQLAGGGGGHGSFSPPGREVGATVATERCAFLAASGEEIRITVEVVPMAPGGLRSP